METIDRRAFLGRLGATSAAVVAVAATAPALAETSHLPALIAAHRSAREADVAAVVAADEAMFAWQQHYKEHPVRERMHYGGCFDPLHDDAATVAREYEKQRIMYCHEKLRSMCPEAHRLVSARVAEMEAEDTAKLPAVFDRFEALKARFDIPRLAKEATAAENAEKAARQALIDFDPRTLAEAKEKAAYIAELFDADIYGPDDSTALVMSMAMGRA